MCARTHAHTQSLACQHAVDDVNQHLVGHGVEARKLHAHLCVFARAGARACVCVCVCVHVCVCVYTWVWVWVWVWVYMCRRLCLRGS